MHNHYVGRFAPSPSGQLHFGSLVTAVASYLDAKSHNGKWLLRMEDIDEPRCIKGVDKDILTTLEAHGLYWDGDVIYQSQQHARYQAVLDDLLSHEKAYFCTCTRKQIKAMGGLMGKVMPSNSSTDLIAEDVVLKRRDGLFSYNLVVILDDVFQQVNHVIRGCDLIDVTPLQRAVYHTLGYCAPEYGHVPVAAVAPGRKLSKQNRAAPVKNETALDNLVRVMHFLGFSFPNASEFGDIDSALKAAISMWDRKKVVKTPEIIVPQHESTYYSEPL